MQPAVIHLERFAGARPRLGTRLLSPNEATIAENCRLWSGELGAWRRPTNVFAVGQNYLRWSNQFQQISAWAIAGLIDVQPNVTTAPDFTLTADKLREDTTSTTHRVQQAVSRAAVSEFWTAACSGKPAERNFMWVQMECGTDFVRVIVNLTTGAVTSSIVNGAFTNLTSSVVAEANGFYRLHVTAQTPAVAGITYYVGVSNDGTTLNYAGTLNSGIYVDGASLRKSNKPGPYRESLATSLPADPSTIYGFRDTWFALNEIAHFAAAPLASDTVDTTYFTRESGEPRVTYSPIAEDPTGSGDLPRGSFSMGLPVPLTPITATLSSYSGAISAASALIQTVGPSATQNYSMAAVAVNGQPIKGKFHFKVTVSTNVASRAKIRFFITRSTKTGEVSSYEFDETFSPEPGLPDVQAFEYTMDFDDSPPAGTHTFTANTTVTFLSGGAFTPTYAHNGATLRYQQTLITSAAHNLQVGSTVQISDVVGMESINIASVVVTVVPDNNHFYIDKDSNGEIYTSGGNWIEVFDEEFVQDTAYVYTWLSTIGGKVLEGPSSAASNIVARGDGQRTLLSLIDTAAPPDGGSYNFSGKRIYRTNVRTDIGANYQFVAEIAVGVNSYVDTLKGVSLGEVLPSETWIKPPSDMKGLTEGTNGVLAGFRGKEICFCEPFQPHAWPLRYKLQTFTDIVVLVATGSNWVVLTRGKPHFVIGMTPGEMQMVKVEMAQPCVSARGAVDMGYAAVYPGDDGMVSLTPGSAQLVTEDILTKEEWKALNPSSIIGAEFDTRYVGFYTLADGTQGGFILDPREQSYTTLDFGASAVWTNPETGDLYVLIDEYIAKWDDAEDFYDFRWRSKQFAFSPVNMGWIKVESSDYPITVDVYSNPDPENADAVVLVDSIDIKNAKPVRLKGGYLGTVYEVEVRGNGEGRVKAIHLANDATLLEARGG